MQAAQEAPTLGGNAAPGVQPPVPPPAGAKTKGRRKRGSGNAATPGPVPPPVAAKEAKEPPAGVEEAKEPAQAPEPAAKPQQPPAAKPQQKVKTVVDKGAVALAIGGIEEQLLEWWPILERQILLTEGEKGATIKFDLTVQPDTEMGLRCRVGSSFSASSLKRTWKAQIRTGKDETRQLELFTA